MLPPLTILVFSWRVIKWCGESSLYKYPAYRKHVPPLQVFPIPLNFLLWNYPPNTIAHSANALSNFVLILMCLNSIFAVIILLGMIKWNPQCLSACVTTLHPISKPIVLIQYRHALLFVTTMFIHWVHRPFYTTLREINDWLQLIW